MGFQVLLWALLVGTASAHTTTYRLVPAVRYTLPALVGAPSYAFPRQEAAPPALQAAASGPQPRLEAVSPPRAEHAEEPTPLRPYSFSYEVASDLTGDVKSARESRSDDGVVRGQFSYVDPEGTLRTSRYTAGHDTGFVVEHENVVGFADPPPMPEAAPVAILAEEAGTMDGAPPPAATAPQANVAEPDPADYTVPEPVKPVQQLLVLQQPNYVVRKTQARPLLLSQRPLLLAHAQEVEVVAEQQLQLVAEQPPAPAASAVYAVRIRAPGVDIRY